MSEDAPRRVDPNATPEKLWAALDRQMQITEQTIAQWRACADLLEKKCAENTDLKVIITSYRQRAEDAAGLINLERRRADVAEQERDQLAQRLAALEEQKSK